MRQRVYSLLRVSGLAIGMASALLLLQWAAYELSYDRFHINGDRIYSLIQEDRSSMGTYHFRNHPLPAGPALKERFTSIESTVRMRSFDVTVSESAHTFSEPNFIYTDPSIFEIFTIPFVAGDAATAFRNLSSVVISAEMAQKYFGDQNALGKVLTVDTDEHYIVSGVMNVPRNSRVRPDFLAPLQNLALAGYDLEQWRSHEAQLFVLLVPGAKRHEVEAQIRDFYKDCGANPNAALKLQPLRSMTLYRPSGAMGSLRSVLVLSTVAILILVIASANFVNLSMAQGRRRRLEIGVRMVSGANRLQLFCQFMVETMLYIIIASLLGFVVAELCLPWFNHVAGSWLSLSFTSTTTTIPMFCVVLITLLACVAYPIALSLRTPVAVMRPVYWQSKSGLRGRRCLVIAQFVLTLVVMNMAAVVYRQVDYIRSHDLGINHSDLFYLRLRGDVAERFDEFRRRMLESPAVVNMTRTFQIPSFNRLSTDADWDGKPSGEEVCLNVSVVDFDYLTTFGISLVDGRGFSRDLASDSTCYILNETAVKGMGIDPAVGKRFAIWERNGSIIGVARDYHFLPLSREIQPLALAIAPDLYRYAVVRFSGDHLNAALEHARPLWRHFAPGYPFEPHLMDEDYETLYQAEHRLAAVLRDFSILAVVLAALGLLGLSSLTAEERTKEVGVRKVLGASVSSILFLFLREFSSLVLVAVVLALGPTLYLAHRWLQSFAYRTSVDFMLLLEPALVALCAALISVSVQITKAALVDPVTSLRYE